jgi:hypothetical protein
LAPGSAAQAFEADDYNELTAVADIDQSPVDRCRQSLKRNAKYGFRS